MPRYLNYSGSAHGAQPQIGVLLTNTGTPADPSPRGVRRYLAEMLADPRLVELPRALWLPILYGLILPLRPRRSARAYRKIWTDEGSPQRFLAQGLARALQDLLSRELPGFAAVELGMHYGEPSIADALGRLRAAGAQRIVVLPLFPQYSGVTTGSSFDRVSAVLSRWRSLPELRYINDYADHAGYIAALQQSILEHWREHGRPQHLLMSFHGMPLRNVEQGDPYQDRCRTTSNLLAAALGLGAHEWSLSFQSRFGYQQWLGPYTVDVIAQLARQGIKRLGVICPGFAVDCLETLEEIAIQGRERFIGLGGESLEYVPSLNRRAEHAAMLAALVKRHCAGWNAAAADPLVGAERAPRLGTAG